MLGKGYKIGLAMALMAALGGCATDQDDTRAGGLLAGAAAGAAVGAASGRGGKAVLVGAVVGAGLGYMAGEYIAQRKQQYVDARAMVDGETEWTQQLTTTTALENENLKGSLTLIDRDIAELQKKKQAKKMSMDDLGGTLKKLQKIRESEEKKLKTAQDEYKVQETLLADAQKAKVDDGKVALYRAQIEAYGQAIKVTQEQLNRINDQQNNLLVIYRS